MVLLVACSGSSNTGAPSSTAASSSSAAPATFTGAVCAAISKWQNRMVDAANVFSTDSPKLDVPRRRARYSRAFDDQKAITDDLRKDIEAAPATGVADAEAIRTALVAATGDVQTTLQRVTRPKPRRIRTATTSSRPSRRTGCSQEPRRACRRCSSRSTSSRGLTAFPSSAGRAAAPDGSAHARRSAALRLPERRPSRSRVTYA